MQADRQGDRQAQARALLAGESRYQGMDCQHGHGGTRYAAGGACVLCAAEYQQARYAKVKAARVHKAKHKPRPRDANSLTQARAARAEARNQSARTYQGQDCDRAHGGTRYTSNGTCVQCANAQRIAQGERIKADRKAKGLPTRNRRALGADILADL